LPCAVAEVRGCVKNLPLQIGIIHGADLADARRDEIHGDGRTEPARADAQDAGGLNLLLPGQTDFRQDQMPRVTAVSSLLRFIKSIHSADGGELRPGPCVRKAQPVELRWSGGREKN